MRTGTMQEERTISEKRFPILLSWIRHERGSWGRLPFASENQKNYIVTTHQEWHGRPLPRMHALQLQVLCESHTEEMPVLRPGAEHHAREERAGPD